MSSVNPAKLHRLRCMKRVSDSRAEIFYMSDIRSTCQKSEAKARVWRSYQEQRLRCGEVLIGLDAVTGCCLQAKGILAPSQSLMHHSCNIWRVHSIVGGVMSAHACRKFDFFPKGTAGADGWMSLYFKYADQFSDNQQIGFGFKLHVINFQFPSQTLTKGMACFADTMPLHCCASFDAVLSWSSLQIMCMCPDEYA